MKPDEEKDLIDLCKDLGWNRVDPVEEFIRGTIRGLVRRVENLEEDLEDARLEYDTLEDKREHLQELLEDSESREEDLRDEIRRLTRPREVRHGD